MLAEIIAIGDELTSGQRLDTNSQWLSQRLLELGVRTLYHSTVGDELAAGIDVFRQATQRAELVIATGGLGPTADDLTRDVLAALAGVELVLDEAALEHIRQLFARRKRPMPERNRVQAKFPRGSRILANPHGTAPGIAMDITASAQLACGVRELLGTPPCRVYALPGVPAEMREIFEASVAPDLRAMQAAAGRVIRTRCIRCFGVGESDLESRLPDLIRRGREPTVGITVSDATISLRIVAEAESEAACEAQIGPTVDTIRQCLGPLVFGEGEEELQDVIVRRLAERGHTLATVECDSGGLLAQWLTAADPNRHVYRGGSVTPSASAQARVAGLAESELPERSGDWSAAVRRMAQHTRIEFGADFGLAIGPFPTTDLATEANGRVFFALASADGVTDRNVSTAGHPAILKPRTIKQALDFVRRSSLGL